MARCFIRHNRMPNANAFLRLYLTKAIHWSANSVRTLLHLCKRISLAEDASASILELSPTATPVCDRTRLLEWLLNAPWQKLAARLPVDDICALSVDVVLSSRFRQNIRTEQLVASDSRTTRCSKDHEEARRIAALSRDGHSANLSRLCYSSLAFKAELLAKKSERVEKDPRPIPSSSPVSCVRSTLNYLKKRLYDVLQEESSNDEVYVVLMKLALLARLLSTLKRLDVLTEDVADCPLIGTLEKHLASSFEILAKIDSDR